MELRELTSADGVRLDVAIHRAVGSLLLGTVIQAHGIAAEKDEGGMFVRLADRLAAAGLTVLRFDFRGHGGSSGGQRGVTIAGEMLDLQSVVDVAVEEFPAPLSIVRDRRCARCARAEYALSTRNACGVVRGRPGPGRGTRSSARSLGNAGESFACPGVTAMTSGRPFMAAGSSCPRSR